MTFMVKPRYRRQSILPEIGEAGQKRLEATVVRIEGGSTADDVAATYLRRAGVDVRRVSAFGAADLGSGNEAIDVALRQRAGESVEALGILDPAARDIAEGALLALGVLRSALDVR